MTIITVWVLSLWSIFTWSIRLNGSNQFSPQVCLPWFLLLILVFPELNQVAEGLLCPLAFVLNACSARAVWIEVWGIIPFSPWCGTHLGSSLEVLPLCCWGYRGAKTVASYQLKSGLICNINDDEGSSSFQEVEYYRFGVFLIDFIHSLKAVTDLSLFFFSLHLFWALKNHALGDLFSTVFSPWVF